MDEAIKVIAWTTLAGATMPLGAAIAMAERIRPGWLEREFRHSVIAFGGGVLLFAVALVLVPEGVRDLSVYTIAVCMMLGGAAFMGLDILLSRSQTSAAQLSAMLADFLPEALALGAMVATGESVGMLLACLIALQNLPEGFNAYREMKDSTAMKPLTIVLAFAALVPLGPIAGLCGLYMLSDHPAIMHAIMLFASGGILYLTFQDIAPKAKLDRAWGPPLGAVCGFLVGVVGQQLLH